jgi:DNA-binding transcriptional MocR family regulator
MLAESIVYDLCVTGALDENIKVVNKALAERRDAVVEQLEVQIPEAKFVVPGGGYFFWMDLAEGSDTAALLPLAKEEGVAFVAGPDFMIEGGQESLRLSFASVPVPDIPEGIGRIARALAKQRA